MEVSDEFTITVIDAPEAEESKLKDIEQVFIEELDEVLKDKTQEGKVHLLRSMLGESAGKEFLHKVDEEIKGKSPQEKVRLLKSYLVVLAFRYRLGEEEQDVTTTH